MPTLNSPKTQPFEYFLFKAIEESSHNFDDNDFSILKTQKLLFLLTVVNCDKNNTNFLINEVFNKFVAMPYGPVEIDVYNETKNEFLSFFKISSFNSILQQAPDFSSLDTQIKDEIDTSIELLIKRNNKIFDLKANVLVEITHRYNSWKLKYSEARQNNSFKEPIPKELIISENKYFSLNPFELI